MMTPDQMREMLLTEPEAVALATARPHPVGLPGLLNTRIAAAVEYVAELERQTSRVQATVDSLSRQCIAGDDAPENRAAGQFVSTWIDVQSAGVRELQGQLVEAIAALGEHCDSGKGMDDPLDISERQIAFLGAVSRRASQCFEQISRMRANFRTEWRKGILLSRADLVRWNLREAKAVASTLEDIIEAEEGTTIPGATPEVARRVQTRLADIKVQLDQQVERLKREVAEETSGAQTARVDGIFVNAEGLLKGYSRERKDAELKRLRECWGSTVFRNDQVPDSGTGEVKVLEHRRRAGNVQFGHRVCFDQSDLCLSQQEMCDDFVAFALSGATENQRLPPGFPGKAARHFRYQQHVARQLNQCPWPTQRHSIEIVRGEQLVSEIEPSGQRLAQYFPHRYPEGVHGISSTDQSEISHVRNLAKTELRNLNGDILFRGLRHAVTDAFYLTEVTSGKLGPAASKELMQGADASHSLQHGPQRSRSTRPDMPQTKQSTVPPKDQLDAARDVYARHMVEELAVSTLVLNEDKFSAALRDETVQLTLPSISLLTADHRRQPGSPDESEMAIRQDKAMQSLANNGKPVALQLRTDKNQQRTVAVIIHPRTYIFSTSSFGANEDYAASSTPGPHSHDPNFSNAVNDRSMRDLLGDAGSALVTGAAEQKIKALENTADNLQHQLEALGNTSTSQLSAESMANQARDEINIKEEFVRLGRSIACIRQLSQQCKDIWRSKSYRIPGEEPCKLSARIALLEHEMGNLPLFNCDSGRDRASYLDAHIKFLASRHQRDGCWPEPDEPLTPEVATARANLLLNSGNLEIQASDKGTDLKNVEPRDPAHRQTILPTTGSTLQDRV